MTASKRSIAFVSREIAPLVGGGIAPVIRAAGELLAERGWDVTFVTNADLRKEWERRTREQDPEAQTAARWIWVEEPDEYGGFQCWHHFWSALVDRALREAFPQRAPDVIEFGDYHAEGFVTIQRRVAYDSWLDNTTIAVRTHTSAEMCSVLNGAIADELHDLSLFEMERYCLEKADAILYEGGDIYSTYERFYGRPLAPGRNIRYTFPGVATPFHRSEYNNFRNLAASSRRGGTDPLYLLFLGRSERRKGIVELAETIVRRPDIDLHLDIVGGDTKTGPLATSIGEHLKMLADADDRITYHGPVWPNYVPKLITAVDAVVVPSRWECWPNVAFESLLIGRPVLGTPVGGLVEIIKDGVTGMLASGTSRAALEALLERAVDEVEQLRAMPSQPAFAEHLAGLVDLDEIVTGYEALIGARRRTRPADITLSADTIDVIIPYHRLHSTLEQTLQSLRKQTHTALDILIVNDGSFEQDDAAAYELAERYGTRIITTPNGGLSAARNAGLSNSSSEYFCMLDADDILDPTFLERCLRPMLADRSLAYVTTWVRYVDDDLEPLVENPDLSGYVPFGNWLKHNSQLNYSGVCTAVMRRSTLDRHGIRYDQTLASYEDWDLYRQLAEHGEFGAVLPDRLFDYRVMPDSMTRSEAQPNVDRLHNELRAANRFRQLKWTPETL